MLGPYCLAHNHITRHKILYDCPFIGILPTLLWWRNSSCRKVIVCAGLPHLRSLWVNKWQVKQRVYSFFLFFFRFSSAPASWWEGWNSHSGWTLTCSLVSCHRQREQEVRGCWAAGAAGDLWSQQNTSTRSHSSQLKPIDWLTSCVTLSLWPQL